jgi:dienelactone hydrolase
MRRMKRLTRARAFAAGGAVMLAAALFAAPPYVRAAAFIVRATGLHGWPEAVASWQAEAFREESRTLPTRDGAVRGRVYRPAATPRQSIVLTSGVHEAGIDEPRLVGLARSLAASGFLVLTPEPVDLMQYRITPRATDTIEDAAAWLLAQPGLASADGGRVGLVGISFSGGLSIVAAGRPSIKPRISFVLSLGGHGNLPRVMRYLCTGIEPTGAHRPPHDYALAVLLYGAAASMVPPEQVDGLHRGLATFLHASAIDKAEPETARTFFEQARAIGSTLPEPAASLLKLANDRNVVDLGPKLLPHIRTLGGDASLSPDRSPPPSAPIFLLHGADDNVIPAVESTLLAATLEPYTDVHVLLSHLISHAEVDKPMDIAEIGRLIALWRGALR